MKEVVNKRALQKELTSKAILSASLNVFSTIEYNAATFTDISKIAKVTNGLIVQRFGSKEALYSQLLNGILSDFPTFKNTKDLNECLLEIIHFIKAIGTRSKEELSFFNTAIRSFNNLPNSCKEVISNLFLTTKINIFFKDEVDLGKIKNKDEFDVLTRFIENCCDLTLEYLKMGEQYVSDDVYIQLFKKLDAVDEAKYSLSNEASIFESISDKALKLYNITTWYAEISEDREPALYFPKTILRKAGVSDDASPQYVYKFILNHVEEDDISVVTEAIHKMLLGQYVEFEYRWSAPSMRTIYYRCSGKRTGLENGITRFEGILQNITSFKTLRNRNKTRNFYLNLIAQDYEYVGYVNLGLTPDDDYVEDFKTSEFLNKLTENWGHSNNFTDRFNVLINKVLTSVDRERFTKGDSRQNILNSLKKSGTFKTTFKIRYFGVVYDYEVVFFPDREDDRSIAGLVCGIRLVNNNSSSISQGETIPYFENKQNKMSNLLLENYDAAFLVNLKDHTFDICKQDTVFARRNSFIPDFEAYIQAYVKRDVYFEDIDNMLLATDLVNLRLSLEDKGTLTVYYRDISKGMPYHYLLRATKGDNNMALVVITNINAEYEAANQNIDKLEEEIRSKDREIYDKNNIIENVNESIIDLIGDIVETRKDKGFNHSYQFKYLTYIFGTQLMQDYPELGLTNDFVAEVSEASVIHDIGKLAIPEEIIYKQGKLTKEEFEVIKTHASHSEKLLNKLKNVYDSAYFKILTDVCKYHHERWNGEGYPYGLAGNDIPLSAQIVGLIDAFHALTSKRTYRDAYEVDSAVAMIINGECGSFNPIFFDSLKKCVSNMSEYMNSGKIVSAASINKSAIETYKFNTVINNQTFPVLTQISEQMPTGFFMYRNDAQGSLLYFNNIMVKYFNCANREDFIKYVNNSFKGIVHADDFEKTVNIINKQVVKSSKHLEHTKYRIVCKNGEEKILDHFGYISHSESFGDISYAFVQDVTQLESNNQTLGLAKSAAKIVEKEPTNKPRVKTLEGTRILIVDDNALSRFMTKETLEDEGAIVSDFSSGATALEAIKKFKPFDIILVDLVMPEMNGVDLTKAIRDWEEDKDIRVPIVAVTGEIESDLAKQCLEEGANGCMSKPLIIEELARLLILSMKEHSNRMERKLTSTIQKANTDVLTNVKNRTAHAERIEQISSILKTNPYYEFGIVGADINNLKVANDKFGHEIGDMYIKNCCRMLCEVFTHSPVYRIGGDEFSVILEGQDLTNYKELMDQLDKMNRRASAIKEYEKGRAHIAMGVAIYNPETDMTIDDVIKRADEAMYKNKELEKARVAGSFVFVKDGK
ncbi:MAG: diguanylate cyclase [Bacilli bacterium]|nr:diguanylate cyclase [Bacilli bacterium]